MALIEMSRLIELTTPHWPEGFDRWESFVTILLLALFKIDRGTIMRRRAPVIDAFGWSIIIFDWVFGAVFMISVFWTLYPDTRLAPWGTRVTVAALLVVTLWQWAMVRRATQDRVELVASGVTNGNHWQPGDPERRTGAADRRVAT